ncbi:MAG: hypothetical protein ACRDHZ_22040, partial [Ktedonobacteraceae bacterium]
TMTRLKVQKAEPLRLEYEDVFAAIQTNSAPTVTGEDGLAVLKIVLQLTEHAGGTGTSMAMGTEASHAN